MAMNVWRLGRDQPRHQRSANLAAMLIAAMQPRGVIPGFLVVRPFHANECPEFIRVRIRQAQHDTSANRTPDQSGLIQRERVAECQYRFTVKSSEERRAGKEWFGTCRSRWSTYD